jgi:energy-coupling factor transporter transmembrane protein EcfT
MTTYLVILGALAAVPILAITAMRVNGAIAFMSLCLGSVLVTYTSDDVDTVLSSMINKDALSIDQWVQLGLLIVPFILALLFTRGSVKGGKSLTNILPAVASGLLCALLVVPLLGANIQRQIHDLSVWHQLSSAQTAVILGGALFSLMFLLFTHRGKKGDEEGKKKKSKHKE